MKTTRHLIGAGRAVAGRQTTGRERRPAGSRLQFTASPTQVRLLKEAARNAGKPVSAFVAQSSCAAAFTALARDPDATLDDAAWEHFLELLGQPAGEAPRLRALLQSDG